jgi:succinate dehydrogenase/fumarate reductase flavoprotein subunit
MDEIVDKQNEISCDVLVIGGGTAGPMAALKAKLADPKATVILLEKANVKRSGAISMGMDGLNNAVIPGYATPEQYTKEITIANDGIVNQKAVLKYAATCYSIIEELDSYGIRFQKTTNGDFAVKKVHHIGTYVLPMPNGETVKKALYRQLRRARLLISNRYMATRLLVGDGRIAGAIAVNTRTAEMLVVRAKAVVLCMGAAGRLGLPTSGYMFGTYENATNSGDGYAMAYHAGAALANLECFQINPLIKDYNGPACAYVAGPFGAYTANNKGQRFIECDYWSGQMMLEFYNELQSGNGPVFLKLNHLHSDTVGEIEDILHKVERPSGALDALTRMIMQELLLDISGRVRTTIVFVTHDIDEALFLADRVLVMSARPGRIVQEIKVPFARPRKTAVSVSQEFMELKRRCLDLLHTRQDGVSLPRLEPLGLDNVN